MWFAFVPCVWYGIQSAALPGVGQGCIDMGNKKRMKGLKEFWVKRMKESGRERDRNI